MKRNQAFTYFELMIVVAIIAILSIMTIMVYRDQITKSRDNKIRSLSDSIATGLTLYMQDKSDYPISIDAINIKTNPNDLRTALVPAYLKDSDFDIPLDAYYVSDGNYYKMYWDLYSKGGVEISGSDTNNPGSYTINNSSSSGVTKVGKALSFSGTNGYLAVDNPWNGARFGDTGFTISTWRKFTDAVGSRQLVGIYHDNGGANSYDVQMILNGYTTLCALNNRTVMTTLLPPLDNQWHHIACTWDGDHMFAYVDGQSGSDVQYTEPFTYTGHKIEIGGYAGTDMKRFAGELDDVRIYDIALTQNEIKKVCGSKCGGMPEVTYGSTAMDNLKLAFPFDTDSGTVVTSWNGIAGKLTSYSGATTIPTFTDGITPEVIGGHFYVGLTNGFYIYKKR